jgi:hypothetical protein
VVAVVTGRRGDHPRGGLVRHPDVGPARDRPRVFEIAVFLVLTVFLIVQAGSNNTAQVFTTHYSPTGLTGVIGGSVFTLLAFGGFEGAAPLAEETRDPRRTIQRAVLLATLLIGVLYVFTTYQVELVVHEVTRVRFPGLWRPGSGRRLAGGGCVRRW